MAACPNCAAPPPEGAAECAACGVVFAKFKRKAEPLPLEKSPPPPDLERRRTAAIVFVVAWLAGFGLWFRASYEDAKRRAAAKALGAPRP